MASRIVSFTLNGQAIEALVKPLTTLQTVLREQLAYTGTKIGCRQGGCGSCTVLVNGQAMLSCLLPAEDVAGQEIITVEGVTPLEGLHPIQQAFLDNFATQCGYCTPGMILVTKALLEQHPTPSHEQILEALSGNVCRCTGYEPIIRAVQDAAQRLNEAKGA
jgi:carbon-monoxide dehydrogenase small subunit